MKAEILAVLRKSDTYVSGQELCEKFGVSRTAVWKAMNQLKKEGYEIEAVQNRGYRIKSAPDILSVNELTSLLQTEWAGKKIYYYDVIDSTNTKASQLAEEGAEHGTLVVADCQEAGKGRRGRTWEAPEQTGIFMTIVLKPDIQPANAPRLTLVAAISVAKAIQKVTGLKAEIKWPNDIVVNGKKVCGILTEMSAQIDYINHIVIGIGINVHNEGFSKEVAQIATSLDIERKQKTRRADLIVAVWQEFEYYYAIYLETEDLSAIRKEYDSYLVNRNQRIKVLDPVEPYEGVAQGITAKGELIVDTWESRKLVSSGEVSVRGIYGYV